MGRIPGTKITVRNNAISSYPVIGTKSTCVIGTAAMGPKDEAVLVVSYKDGVDVYGEYDGFYPHNPEGSELTLVRGLQLHFAQGGGPVWAIRSVGTSGARATFTILADSGDGLPIAAKYYGGYGNNLYINAVDDSSVQSTVQDDYMQLSAVASEALRHVLDANPSKRAKPTASLNSDSSEVSVIDTATNSSTNYSRVFIETDYQKADPNVGADVNQGDGWGAAADDMYAFPFKTFTGFTVDKLRLYITDSGNVIAGGDITVSVQTDNAGKPSGTIVGDSFTLGIAASGEDFEILGAALPNDETAGAGGWTELDLTTAGKTITLTSNSTYWLVFDIGVVLTFDVSLVGYEGTGNAVADNKTYTYQPLFDLNGDYTADANSYHAKISADIGVTWTKDSVLCASIPNSPYFALLPVLNASQCTISCGDSDVDQAGAIAKELWFLNSQDVSHYIKATYNIEDSKKVTIVYSPTNDPVNDAYYTETYNVHDCEDLARDITTSSKLVDAYSATAYADTDIIINAVKLTDMDGNVLNVAKQEYRPDDLGTSVSYIALGNSTYGGTGTVSGNNGADAGATEFTTALQVIESYDVWIVVLPGQYDATVHAVLDAHVVSMRSHKKERFGIVGHRLLACTNPSSPLSTHLDVMALTDTINDMNINYVSSPDIKTADTSASSPTSGETVTLSSAYASCLMSGALSAQDVGLSLTNKTISSVVDIGRRWRPTEIESLMDARIECMQVKNGIRWVSGLTTSSEALWKNIMTVEEHMVLLDTVRAATEEVPGNRYVIEVLLNIKRGIISALKYLTRQGIITAYKNVDVYGSTDDQLAGVVNVALEVVYTKEIKYVDVFLTVN